MRRLTWVVVMVMASACYGQSRPATQPASRPTSRPATTRPAGRASVAEVRAAVKAGRVIEGMSIVEARQAMKGAKERLQRNGKAYTYIWTHYKQVPIPHQYTSDKQRAGALRNPSRMSWDLKQQVVDREVRAVIEMGLVIRVVETQLP